MNVLLISANTETINMPTLPMGLGHVAAAVQRAGHRVRFVDLLGDVEPLRTLEREVSDFQPDAIGISIRNVDDQCSAAPRFLLEGARGVVSACRRLSNAPVVLGGAGYSLFPQSMLDFLDADMGIQGEGEDAFVALLAGLRDRDRPVGVPGLYLRGHGLLGPRAYRRVLDDLPFPTPETFGGSLADRTDCHLPVQTRRGCPLRCSYCATAAIEGAMIRKRSPEAVVQALAAWRRSGFRQVFFVDNTFNLPPAYARRLCDRIAGAQLGISWRCILYPGRVDEPLVRSMARAGCTEVSLGFESANREVLNGMRKRFEAQDVRHTSRLLADCGIRRMGFLLLGGPDETRRSVSESLSFVDSLGLESVKVTIGIRIYPYTRLAAIARAEGRITPSDDLLQPRFYIARGLEDWLRETVAQTLAMRPNWLA
jgi:radical SAM superfamily enzyme YgiQ (UPF0313 family)